MLNIWVGQDNLTDLFFCPAAYIVVKGGFYEDGGSEGYVSGLWGSAGAMGLFQSYGIPETIRLIVAVVLWEFPAIFFKGCCKSALAVITYT